MTADPMYRNLAVLTGKVHMSWQAQRFADEGAVLGAWGYRREGYAKNGSE